MFTGIIRYTGKVVDMRRTPPRAWIKVETPFKKGELERGGSVAVNGICLTAEEVMEGVVKASLSMETLERTNLPELDIGDVVNLELPLTLNTPLGGHLVQGHGDGMGEIIAIIPEETATTLMKIKVPGELLPWFVEKGSVAVDGISLTVKATGEDHIELALVPHTLCNTNLPFRQVGDKVNIEIDIIAKYVKQYLLLIDGGEKGKGLTEELLKKAGF